MSHTRPVHLCQSHVVTYQHLLEVAGGEAAPTILGKGTSCCNEAANQRPAFVKHSSHFSYTLFLRGGFVIDLFDPFSLHPWYLFHSSSLFSRFPSSSLGSFHIYRFFRVICAYLCVPFLFMSLGFPLGCPCAFSVSPSLSFFMFTVGTRWRGPNLIRVPQGGHHVSEQ